MYNRKREGYEGRMDNRATAEGREYPELYMKEIKGETRFY